MEEDCRIVEGIELEGEEHITDLQVELELHHMNLVVGFVAGFAVAVVVAVVVSVAVGYTQ